MVTTPRILLHDKDYCTAAWRDLFVLIWRHETTLEGIKAGRDALASMGQSHPDGCAMLTIVEPGAPMPPAEARDALSEVLRDAGDIIKVSAVVFEGAGFRAAAVRSVVTGISLVAKQPYPHKVFATVDAAASWLSPSLPEGPTPPQTLVDSVVTLREELASLGGGS